MMRVFRSIFALCMALAATLASQAQGSADLPHVHVQLISPAAQYHPGINHAGLYFRLESGWHVYWKNPGDAGEPPHMKWILAPAVSAGPIEYPVPKRLPLGPLMDFGYEDEVVFPFEVRVSPDGAGPVVLHAKVDWLVCRGSCIPEKTELEITRSLGPENANLPAAHPDQELWDRLANRLPQSVPAGMKAGFTPTANGFRLVVDTGRREKEGFFFPGTPDVLSNPAPQAATPAPSGLSLDLKKDENLASTPAELSGLLVLSGGRAYELAVSPGSPQPARGESAKPARPDRTATSPDSGAPAGSSPAGQSSPGLLGSVGLAFVGGLLLNLMPCVFPVLFIKGFSLVQSGKEERHKLRTHGLVYALGILISFWALVAALLVLRSAGAHLGWGFQFQSPVFLFLIAALLFFLGLSLAGQFEIGLTLTSAGDSLASRRGYTGSFFTGVLAVVVATPCTAPFMGVALGYALSQSAAVTFAVFTALALGLAAPYVVLTLEPAWTRLLPRPGSWMEILKQAVSVPIFATVIWLAWVLANAYGAALLAVLLISFLLLATAGWFLGRWPAKRWSTLVAAVIVLAVLGLSAGAPGYLVRSTLPAEAASSGWQPWSADGVAQYQSRGRPVFVDFTASWCLSCQVNERIVLRSPEVQKAFADANVVLMRADWTRYDDSITRTLNGFGRSGVPAYALYVPGQAQPRVLPEVLTTGIVTSALSGLPRSSTQTAASASNQ